MGFRTQEQVDRLRLPAGKSDHWEFDAGCTGLSIRLQGRKRTWVVWYHAPSGPRRKVTIGDVAAVRLREARQQATHIVQAARDGQDVGAQRTAAREAARARAADTLGRLVAIYLERYAKPNQRPRTLAESTRYLQRYWAPLHGRPVDSVTRRDVAEQIERIRVEHGATAANHARVYLSGCYAWAMRQGFAEHNPTIGTEPPVKLVKRDRVLAPTELAAVWRACGDDDFGRIVRLLLLLGQRRQEIAGMSWSEIDAERKLWVIPSSRTKNSREHEVPLPGQAIALLPDRRPGRDLVFGRSDGAFSGFSRAKASLDKAAGLLTPWRLHDLRRSTSTYLHEIGISSETVDAVLNHARPGVQGVYNHSKLREPKRAALQRYAAWIERLLNGEQANNVLAFG